MPHKGQEGGAVLLPLEVRLERIKKDSHGKKGKVHITVGGAPIDNTWDRETFRNHPGGVEQVGWEEFLANPCGVSDIDGHIGPNGCVSVLVRGVDTTL